MNLNPVKTATTTLLAPDVISSKDYSMERYHNQYIGEKISLVSTTGSKIYDVLNDWESRIRELKTCSEIISVFWEMNMDKTAERLDFLNNLVHEDVNEPSMDLESLREMAIFIIDLKLPKPLIGLTDDGLIEIQWHISPNGLLVMDFLPSKEIEYVAIYPESQDGGRRDRMRGTSSKENLSNKISIFFPLLEQQ